ncbi:MAG TPA: hypothetical protein VHH35_10860, partial [Pyrinomonadaceae bacterium]|nr:hypothetical protein [Pyrinomonadaceae bacterium]
RDDLPRLKGVDSLKNGSPLGVEPKDGGISGVSGFSTGPATTTEENASPTAQKAPASTTPGGTNGENGEKKPAAPPTAVIPATAAKSNTPQ